jgi:hypothetical protein
MLMNLPAVHDGRRGTTGWVRFRGSALPLADRGDGANALCHDPTPRGARIYARLVSNRAICRKFAKRICR